MTQLNYNSRANRYINPTINIEKRIKVLLSFDSLLPVGKYKGQKVVDIINKDLRYILWAKKEGVFLFDDSTLEFIREKRKESEKEKNIVYKPREFAPYVKVEKKASCKTVYVFDENYNQITTFESAVKAAEYFNTNSSIISYCIKNRKPFDNKYILSHSEYILFID